MTKKSKIVQAKIALIVCALPVLVWAFESGPPERSTGAPGDSGTCAASGCHTGTAVATTTAIQVILPGGNTYTPGVKQHVQVKITDSAQNRFGFQMTARVASSPATLQAGDFASTDSLTLILCSSGVVKSAGGSCPAQFPIQFIEHSLAGYQASTKATYTYGFDWTPPATNVGNVTLYVAANAANGDLTTSGDHIYTTNVTLTPAVTAPTPTLTNVLDAESARASMVPGQWAAIYGSNLSNTTRFWGDSDFTGGVAVGSPLPKTLDGVSVTMNGLPAAIYFVSPGQLNVQVPTNVPQGSIPVVVTNNGVTGTAFQATIGLASPSFFYYGAGGKVFPLAVHLNGKLIGDPAISGAGVEKAHPNETIELFMNGLAASPGGSIVAVAGFSPSTLTVTADSTPLTVLGAALIFAGEYQVNVQLPANLPTKDYALTLNVTNGSTSTSGVTVLLPVGP